MSFIPRVSGPTIGIGATQAASGAALDALLATFQPIVTRNFRLDAAANDFWVWREDNLTWLNAGGNRALGIFRLDPARLPTVAGRTKKVGLFGRVWTNATAPGVDVRFRLTPGTPNGGAAATVTAAIGADLDSVDVLSANLGASPTNTGATFASAGVTLASAADYLLAIQPLGAGMAANSSIAGIFQVGWWSV